MYPAPIDEYVRPATVADALAALGRYEDGDAAFIAGGQSLMQAVKARLVRPRCLIDLQAVSGLSGIDVGAEGVRIGPMTRYAEIARDERLGGACAALRDAAERVGDRQVRNRGTVGGSLCWNYVAACMPPTAIGLGARLELTAADGGTRTIAAEDFLGGPLETAREENEILTAITIPAAGNAGSAYKKWGLVTDALPVIGVCVALEVADGRCASARVAIGGLAEGPTRSAAGEAALSGVAAGDRDGIAAAMDAAAAEIETQADLWADSDYRKQLIRSLGAEVTASAFARAAG
jgi:carbon-monoxide dehydrogenase medium subunit